MVSVFDKDLIGSDDALGDGIVKLSTITERNFFKPIRVTLIDKQGDPVQNCYIEIDLKVGCAFTAYGTEEEYLYEYERWNLVNGWSSDHLLPTDPGRWSDKSMKR